MGDCDKAIHCFLWAWHTLQSQTVLWGQEGLFLLWIDSLILFAERAPNWKCVCVCVVRFTVGPGWEGKSSADQGGGYWSWHCSPCMGEPQPTCKGNEHLQLHLDFEYKVLRQGRNWKSMSLSFHIKYTNLLTLHFQQAASHLQNAKYLLYCCENKSVDVSERVTISCWMPRSQKGF